MKIIVKSKKIDLDRIQGEMSTIQKELSAQKDHVSFLELDGQLSKRLDRLEKGVITTKKVKLIRDRIDYENNSVCTWKKTFFQPGRSGKVSVKKRVSFSDQESEPAYDTLAATASDSSLDTGRFADAIGNKDTQHLNSEAHGTKKKKKKKKQENEEGKEEALEKQVEVTTSYGSGCSNNY